ncbi:MAG: T9SS type A sorting domain-containing protein [Bacteroidota bacterium]|nr:T9SS type A sorting domain-containing protein [Bacteroidota bacterium]MDP4230540.1 T9SS type A sorting domain-containing protein [Bacteroidota bacterium]MDP4236131.1 T9SS type A sorting domain-containing protein [Bacteroidota bacterium]
MKIRGLLIAASCIALSAASAFAQYSVVSSVIGSGGGPMSNATYSMNGTVGQAVVGLTTGTTYSADQGFWHTLPTTSGVTPIGPNAGYDLEQNFPNPFNPSTVIRFSIPERVKVTLKVMNLLGEEVKRLIDGEYYEAGKYDVDFLAQGLPSGTYVYKLEAGNFIKSRKMVLAK